MKDIMLLESVPRRAANMVKGLEGKLHQFMNTVFYKSTKNASASALISLDIRSYFNGQLLLPIHVQNFYLTFCLVPCLEGAFSQSTTALYQPLLNQCNLSETMIRKDMIKQLLRTSNLPIRDKQNIFLVVLTNLQFLPSSY